MEASEELEWELYDIFISGIFDFPIYEHNSARRIVRYLLMRGVDDADIASAIEGPTTVDLRLWLNRHRRRREGKHLVGEWVIAWLNECQHQHHRSHQKRPTPKQQQQDQRRNKEPHHDDDHHHRHAVEVAANSNCLLKSSGSRSVNDDSDLSSDYDLTDHEGGEDSFPREAISQTSRANSRHTVDAISRNKLNRPQNLTLDPDHVTLLPTPTGSFVAEAPDSGHVTDTPCSFILQQCPVSSSLRGGDELEDGGSPEVVADELLPLPEFCRNCRCTVRHYVKVVEDNMRPTCFRCQMESHSPENSHQTVDRNFSQHHCHKTATA